MNKVWIIFKWEYINRVKSKLFLITTFVLPIFMIGLMYVPTLLMDLEPETTTKVGLVHEDTINPLVQRFKDQVGENYRLKNGNSQFIFVRQKGEVSAMDSIRKKSRFLP